MQSKLNEILELCIEKSKGRYFYEFNWCSRSMMLTLTKRDGSYREWNGYQRVCGKLLSVSDLDEALEYMQNE